MLEQYVKKILTSRVYDVAVETPLQTARQLSERLGNEILPAICTERGSGSPSWIMRMRDLRVFHKLMSLVTISETTRPAPSRLHS